MTLACPCITWSDGNGNPLPGANALDYINITGSVSENNTQVFPTSVALPFKVVVDLLLREQRNGNG